jgi:O-antigen/teichoic acid export membrane protein
MGKSPIIDPNPAPVISPETLPVANKISGSGDAGGHHFTTDHLLTNLKGRAISSGFVTVLSQGVQFVLSLASTVVLARLLLPEDFGLIAMVVTVTGFLRIFNDAGLSTATIQREGITHAQVSNLFWTNAALGGAITLLLAVLSPVIAWFYREPRLVDVTLALSITFLLASSTVQHQALLKRQMRFKVVAMIEIGAAAFGVLTGIGMALQHYGYWSLVGMQLSTSVSAMVLTWFASRWRPQLPKRRSGTRSLLHFGANLTASSFLWSLARGSDGLLIGRVYGAAPLGLYNRAGALVMRPVQQFIGPIESVFVPVLSRLQTQPERYRRVVLQAYEAIAVASFLFTGLLLGLAHPLTLAVLGGQWDKAAPIFAGFTLVALFTPIGSVATWLLTSQGRGREFLTASMIGSCMTIVAFLVGLPFGPLGVAVSYSVFCILFALPVNYYIAGRRGPVTTKDLWGRFFTHLPLWVVVCAVTCLTRSMVLNTGKWEQLAICAPVSLMSGIGFICIYPPARRVAFSLLGLLREWKTSRKVTF